MPKFTCIMTANVPITVEAEDLDAAKAMVPALSEQRFEINTLASDETADEVTVGPEITLITPLDLDLMREAD